MQFYMEKLRFCGAVQNPANFVPIQQVPQILDPELSKLGF